MRTVFFSFFCIFNTILTVQEYCTFAQESIKRTAKKNIARADFFKYSFCINPHIYKRRVALSKQNVLLNFRALPTNIEYLGENIFSGIVIVGVRKCIYGLLRGKKNKQKISITLT